jgi:hypothetical protein
MNLHKGDIIKIFYNDIEYITIINNISALSVELKKIRASYGAKNENKFYYKYNDKIIEPIETDKNDDIIKQIILINTKTNSLKHILNTNNMRISKHHFLTHINDMFFDEILI